MIRGAEQGEPLRRGWARPGHGVPAPAPSPALEECDAEAAQPGERGGGGPGPGPGGGSRAAGARRRPWAAVAAGAGGRTRRGPGGGRLRGAAAWAGGEPAEPQAGGSGGVWSQPPPPPSGGRGLPWVPALPIAALSPRRPGPGAERCLPAGGGQGAWVPSGHGPTERPGSAPPCAAAGMSLQPRPGPSPAGLLVGQQQLGLSCPAPTLRPWEPSGSCGFWLEEPRAVGWTPSPTQRTALRSISFPAKACSLSQMPQALASPVPGPQGLLSRLAELSPSPQYPQAINRFPNSMWVRAAYPPWAGEELLPLSGHETEEWEVPGGPVPSRGWRRWQDGTFPARVTNLA